MIFKLYYYMLTVSVNIFQYRLMGSTASGSTTKALQSYKIQCTCLRYCIMITLQCLMMSLLFLVKIKQKKIRMLKLTWNGVITNLRVAVHTNQSHGKKRIPVGFSDWNPPAISTFFETLQRNVHCIRL